MTRVIATINLKGGVGKTTLTIALAEILSEVYGLRVLVIDLDPQTNATVMLIGEHAWKERNDRYQTLATLFGDAVSPDSAPLFEMAATRIVDASPVRAAPTVDLLPSSLDLIDIQDRLYDVRSGRFFTQSPTDILTEAVEPVLSEYDYVLVDCPPNVGIVTLNGLKLADGYLVPTIPDVLSTYGIPPLVRRVARFSRDIRREIKEIGIVISKIRGNSQVHAQVSADLPTRIAPESYVFTSRISEANDFASAAQAFGFGTVRQRYGANTHQLLAVADEFLERTRTVIGGRYG